MVNKMEQFPGQEPVISKADREVLERDFFTLKQELNAKFNADDPETLEVINRVIEERVGHLQTKYPDCLNYAVFHVLKRAGALPKDIKYFDFPGDDSVVTFVEGL